MEAIQQVSGPMYLFPAYGTIYTSSKDAVKDWMAGADFKIMGSSYCSIRDLELLKSQSSSIWIYWNRVDCVRVL